MYPLSHWCKYSAALKYSHFHSLLVFTLKHKYWNMTYIIKSLNTVNTQIQGYNWRVLSNVSFIPHAQLISLLLLSADLLTTNRSSVFSGHHGQLSITAVYLDEYRDRLFLGGKDVLYSLMLGPGSSESKEVSVLRTLMTSHWPVLHNSVLIKEAVYIHIQMFWACCTKIYNLL